MLRFFIGEDDLLTFREKLLQRGDQLRVFRRNGVSYGLFVNAKLGQALIHFLLKCFRYLQLNKLALIYQGVLRLLRDRIITVVVFAGGLFRQTVRQLLHRIGVLRQETIGDPAIVQVHVSTYAVHIPDY